VSHRISFFLCLIIPQAAKQVSMVKAHKKPDSIMINLMSLLGGHQRFIFYMAALHALKAEQHA
jgi:hypothetical protein